MSHLKKSGSAVESGRPPFWYWLLIPLVFVLSEAIFDARHMTMLPYSDFKHLLYTGKVSEAAIGDETITAYVNQQELEKVLPKTSDSILKCSDARGCAVTVVRVPDPDLAKDMLAANVHFKGLPKNNWLSNLLSWLFPIALIFWLWSIFARRGGMASGGLFDIGKSRARVYVADKSAVKFDDVAGIDEAKVELMEIVDFLRNPQRYVRLGGRIPKGVLIVGPPGTGKTLLAKAVAGEAGVVFFSISGSEFVEMFVGVGAARVRDLFKRAEEKAPCIIFIDELDALGRARGMANMVGGYNEQEQTLNQLLVEMDGFDSSKGVILLAATNRPEILDAALLRPGRFDRQIALDRPDIKGREKILLVHSRKVILDPTVDLAIIAARTAGFAGADLANLVNEAALLAGRRGKQSVDMDDFSEAIDRTIAGLEKRTRVMNRTEKETVAYHEAGHALIAEFRPHADRVAKVSIIPRGTAALGYTQQLPTEDRYLLKRTELFDRLDVLLGGRVAEEIVFGDISTGAQDDLQRATDMVRHMVVQYGMSERLGLATYGQSTMYSQQRYLPTPQGEKNYSERTARIVDAEIGALLAQAHDRVKETLTAKRDLLEALAKMLLTTETVDRAALDALLSRTGVKTLLKA